MALETLAVLLILPDAVEETTPRKRVVDEVPFAIVPKFKEPFHGCQDAPLFCENSVFCSADGTASVKTTEAAALGPLFRAVRV